MFPLSDRAPLGRFHVGKGIAIMETTPAKINFFSIIVTCKRGIVTLEAPDSDNKRAFCTYATVQLILRSRISCQSERACRRISSFPCLELVSLLRLSVLRTCLLSVEVSRFPDTPTRLGFNQNLSRFMLNAPKMEVVASSITK